MAGKPPAAVLASSRLANVRYADKEYWNTRYTSQPCEFDWFYGYVALRKIVRAFIKRNKLILHVGCGNSNFQEGMAKDGYKLINTDISDVVIEQMRAKHKHVPNLRYVLSDCRSMPEFLDFQFGSVIDKGTVDALLCSKDAADNIRSMFKEISRVLIPGGVFLLITLGGPEQRLALVNREEFGWTVQVCLVRRVAEDEYAPSEPGRAIPLNDTPRPLSYIGPLEVLPDGTVAGLPAPFEPSSYFYAYVCRKAPLVLPNDNTGGQDGKVRLPDSWKAAVRAVAQVVGGELGLPQGILGRGRRVKVTSRASFERQQQERERERELRLQLHRRVAEASSARTHSEAQLALPPPQEAEEEGEEEQQQRRRADSNEGDSCSGGAADGWGSDCPGSALELQDEQQQQHQRQHQHHHPQPEAVSKMDESDIGATSRAAAAAAAPPPAQPAPGAAAAAAAAGRRPALASRLGAPHLPHAISYRRLSATVQDAFSRLDAVDGECSSSCTHGYDNGDATGGLVTPVAARGGGAAAPTDLDAGAVADRQAA